MSEIDSIHPLRNSLGSFSSHSQAFLSSESNTPHSSFPEMNPSHMPANYYSSLNQDFDGYGASVSHQIKKSSSFPFQNLDIDRTGNSVYPKPPMGTPSGFPATPPSSGHFSYVSNNNQTTPIFSKFPTSSSTEFKNASDTSFLSSPVSPRMRENSSDAPFWEREQIKPFFSKIPIEDVILLREFLNQVNTKKFGFRNDNSESSLFHSQDDLISLRSTPKGRKNQSNIPQILPSPSSSLTSPSPKDESYSFSHNGDDDYNQFRYPKNSPSTKSKFSNSSSFRGATSSLSAKLRNVRKSAGSPDTFSDEKKKSSSLGSNSNGTNPSHPSGASNGGGVVGPYRGRYGPNPSCASCQTTKTPYWRDAWHSGVLLCNACGLRFAKFKRRCINCHYVPRKEDKSNRQCPLCKGSWTQ